MNKTFKVARSLTRGTVVTSEKASSYQGKAVKTVVAAAVSALMLSAGAAMAADAYTVDGSKIEITGTVEVKDVATSNKLWAENSDVTVKEGANITIGGTQGDDPNGDKYVQGGEAWRGSPMISAEKSFTMEGGTITLGNNGMLSVTQDAFNVNKGTIVLDGTSASTATGENAGGLAVIRAVNNDTHQVTLNVGKDASISVTGKGLIAAKAITLNGKVTADNDGQLLIAAKPTFTQNHQIDASTVGSNALLITGGVAISGNGAIDVRDNASGAAIDDATLSFAAPKDGKDITGLYASSFVFGTADKTEYSTKTVNVTLADGAAIYTGGTATFYDGTYTLGGEQYAPDTSNGNTDRQGAWRKNSMIAADNGLTINGGTFNLNGNSVLSGKFVTAEGGTINVNGTANALAIVRAFDTSNGNVTLGKKAVMNVTGAGFVALDGKNGEFVVNGDLNVADNAYLLVDTIKATDGKDKAAALLKDQNTGLTVASGKVSVGTTGSLSTKTLTLVGGEFSTSAEKVTLDTLNVTGGTFTVGAGADVIIGTVNAKAAEGAKIAVANSGKIYVNLDQLVKAGDADGYVASNDFATAIKDDTGTGYVVDRKVSGTYTMADLAKYEAVLGAGNVVLAGAELVAAEGETLTMAKVKGGIYLNTTVTETTAKATASETTTIGAISFKDAAAGVTVEAATDKTLTLAGDKSGNLVNGVKADETVAFTGNIVLGNDDEVLGIKAVALNNDASVSGSLTTVGEVSLKQVELKTGAKMTVDGVTTAAAVKGGSVTVTGDLTVAGTYVEPTSPAAAAEVEYTVPQKVETSYTVADQDDGPAFLTFGNGSTAFNQQVAEFFKNDQGESTVDGILVLNKQIDLTSGALTIGSNATTATTGQIQVGSTGAAVVDVKTYAQGGYDMSKGIVAGTTSGSISNLVLTNLDKSGFKKQGDGSFIFTVGTNVTTTTVEVDSDFYDAVGGNGTATVTVDENEIQSVKDAGIYLAGQVEKEVRDMSFSDNAITQAIIFDNASSKAYRDGVDAEEQKLVAAYETATQAKLTKAEKKRLLNLDAKGLAQESAEARAFVESVRALNERAEAYFARSVNAAANMAVEGGAFSTAMDVQEQVNKAVARRTSVTNLNTVRGDVGVTPWVDVFGTTNEAKRLYGNGMGYEADIYGAVLGFDYTAACGGVLGLAFNVGTADGNSVGSDVGVDNDVDFYGVSLYAAKQFGAFNVQADFGYTQTSNDLSTTGAAGTFKESLDADIYTFGLGTEYKVEAGVANVTPHAGIRLTSIDMDDSKFGADYDRMTVYQLPLGVAVSSTFETNGWKVAPMVDVSVVPTFGDKDAVASFIGKDVTTRVVDSNPVQATLGVNAQNGAFTFGLNYSLSAGSDDRMNNSFNANVRYAF